MTIILFLVSVAHFDGTSPKSNDSGAHGSFVCPLAHHSSLGKIVFNNIPCFARDRETLAIMPPREVGDSAMTADASFRDPLRGLRVEDIDHTHPAFSSRSHQTHPATAGREFEPLHATLLVAVTLHACHLFDAARGQIPDVEITSLTRKEDAVALRWLEDCRCDGRVADVQRGQKWIRIDRI